MRKQAAEQNYNEKYRDMLDSNDFDQLMDFNDWFENHPKAFEIMDFLRN